MALQDSITIKPAEITLIGENVKVAKQGDTLVIVVDTSVEIGRSQGGTGKMMGNASTGGFAQMPGGLKGNVYVGHKI